MKQKTTTTKQHKTKMAQQLITAAKNGDITSVKRLIEGGTKVNSTDGNGMTALQYAAGRWVTMKSILAHYKYIKHQFENE